MVPPNPGGGTPGDYSAYGASETGTVRYVPAAASLQSVIDISSPGDVVKTTQVHNNEVATFSKASGKDDIALVFEGGSMVGITTNGAGSVYAIKGDASNITVRGDSEANKGVVKDYRGWYTGNQLATPHQGMIVASSNPAGERQSDHGDRWLIQHMEVSGGTGWGITPGRRTCIAVNEIHRNGIAGVGGGNPVGGLIDLNHIHRNGGGATASNILVPGTSEYVGDYLFGYPTPSDYGPSDYLFNAGGIKFGFANADSDYWNDQGQTNAAKRLHALAEVLTISRNLVEYNGGVGVWVDVECQMVHVIENVTRFNGNEWLNAIGIYIEVSGHMGGYRNMQVLRNESYGHTKDFVFLRPAEIFVWGGDNLLIQDNDLEVRPSTPIVEGIGIGNTYDQTGSPLLINDTARERANGTIEVITNDFAVAAGAAGRMGVRGGTGTPAGLSYTNNTFTGTEMDFYNNGGELTKAQWQALGYS